MCQLYSAASLRGKTKMYSSIIFYSNHLTALPYNNAVVRLCGVQKIIFLGASHPPVAEGNRFLRASSALLTHCTSPLAAEEGESQRFVWQHFRLVRHIMVLESKPLVGSRVCRGAVRQQRVEEQHVTRSHFRQHHLPLPL